METILLNIFPAIQFNSTGVQKGLHDNGCSSFSFYTLLDRIHLNY